MRAVLLAVGAVVILLAFVVVGVPAMAKFAVFLGGLKGSSQGAGNDTLAPPPPKLVPLPDWVNTEAISVRGYTESDVEVDLYLNGEKYGSGLADNGGEFLFGEVKLASGSNELYVMARDKSGNQGQPSATVRVNLDRESPKLVVVSPTEDQVFSGQGNKKIKVSGESEPEASIQVNGRGVIVDGDGRFEMEVILNDGDQEIKITTQDRAGNTTERQVRVRFDP